VERAYKCFVYSTEVSTVRRLETWQKRLLPSVNCYLTLRDMQIQFRDKSFKFAVSQDTNRTCYSCCCDRNNLLVISNVLGAKHHVAVGSDWSRIFSVILLIIAQYCAGHDPAECSDRSDWFASFISAFNVSRAVKCIRWRRCRMRQPSFANHVSHLLGS